MKTSELTTKIGAVSPMALDIAKMMPDIMLGIACGKTTIFTTCHRVAPIA